MATPEELKQRRAARRWAGVDPARSAQMSLVRGKNTTPELVVRRLLHGHTHRPAVHSLEIDGEPAERIVLGAWHDEGYVLHWNEDGYRVELI